MGGPLEPTVPDHEHSYERYDPVDLETLARDLSVMPGWGTTVLTFSDRQNATATGASPCSVRFNLDPLVVSAIAKVFLTFSVGKLAYKTGQISGGGAFASGTSQAVVNSTAFVPAVVGSSVTAVATIPSGCTCVAYIPPANNVTFNQAATGSTQFSVGTSGTFVTGVGGGNWGLAGYDSETASSLTTVNVKLDGVDQTTALGGPWVNNTDVAALDLTSLVTTKAWHQVDVLANGGSGGIMLTVFVFIKPVQY
jgi:hypothetical protein